MCVYSNRRNLDPTNELERVLLIKMLSDDVFVDFFFKTFAKSFFLWKVHKTSISMGIDHFSLGDHFLCGFPHITPSRGGAQLFNAEVL